MFKAVLIANRGEIACRIARTAKRLGLRTIAVYSEADATALHVRLCDEAQCIGPAEPRQSYLAIERLVDTAKKTAADCVHPGYGFLSENADFVDACHAAGLAFIGPPAAAIRAMGEKDRAKTLMDRAGVPIVPGYHGERQDIEILQRKAAEVGFPVLIKPAAGGGGRGLRRVDAAAELPAALASAVREAEAAFGIGRVLIEKYIAAPRHIEIQIFADRMGNVIHLGERDCSLQRRHQKVIEEAPAVGMTPALRATMGAAAVEAARSVGYIGAGTVEFIAEGSGPLRPDGFWFIEMNTRLQVEHPVTEAVTGLDLVEWQFRIAAGEHLPLAQGDVQLDGHAIEARVYAEDPENGFLPSTGSIVALELPPDLRVDSGVEAGGAVTPYYDSMVAKLIARGSTRQEAIDRLTHALDRTVIAGPRSNVAFLGALCRARAFRDGKVDTGFIDRNLTELDASRHAIDGAAAAAGVRELLRLTQAQSLLPDATADGVDDQSPWAASDGFQLGGQRVLAVAIVVDGENAEATVRYGSQGVLVAIDEVGPAADARVFTANDEAYVLRGGRQTRVRMKDFAAASGEVRAGDGIVKSPMHGRLLEILVAPGDRVSSGERLAVIEAMKMEHTLRAPIAGVVTRAPAKAGAQVVEGAEIVVIEPDRDA